MQSAGLKRLWSEGTGQHVHEREDGLAAGGLLVAAPGPRWDVL